MIIDIITIFPEMFTEFLSTSIVKRAIEDEKIKVNLHNLRDYSHSKHKSVDDTPFGGGVGMLMAFPPFYDAIMKLKTANTKVIYLSPQGKILTQETAFNLSNEKHLILLAGHYEGIDARVEELVDLEISIGNYVLTGGEIPIMVLIDAVTRLIPNVIQEESVVTDSLSQGLLKYPQYTKPRSYKGYDVPEVLFSGHHGEIAKWRHEMSLKNTFLKRPDLIEKLDLSKEDKKIIKSVKK